MRSELKLGILLGIVLVVAVILYLSQNGTTEEAPPEMPVATSGQEDVEIAPIPGDPDTDEPGAVADKSDTEQPQEQPTPEPVVTPPVVKPEPQPLPEVPEPPVVIPPETAPRYHTVKKGDSLHSISESYYGNGKYTKEIFEANRSPKGPMRNPNMLQVGWKLRIPSASEIAGQ